jgi:hypothetical protein
MDLEFDPDGMAEFLTTDYEDCVRVENDINDLHIQADKEIGVQNGQ